MSVADDKVQALRAAARISGGRRLHEYANLYVNGRNAMLFQLLKQGHKLCVSRVSASVLDLPGVVVTDQNAARGKVRFGPADQGLERLDEAVLYAQYWTHPDPLEQDRRKGIMQAEVLVPSCVEPKLIIGAYVSSADNRMRLNRDVPDLDVLVDPARVFA